MKYLILLGDGMADLPHEKLGGKTPLELANKPLIDRLATYGELGLCDTTPKGCEPGSDVNNMAILGYDAGNLYTGRSPLEAAAMGYELADDDVAFRCNLVTLEGEGTDAVMKSYSAGSISTEEAAEIIHSVHEKLGGDHGSYGRFTFRPGISYRHLMVWHGGREKHDLKPPHNIADRPVKEWFPTDESLRWLMLESRKFLMEHPVNKRRVENGKLPANSVWFWGQGKRPQLPKITDHIRMSGAMISAVDLLRGIGRLAGMEVIKVPGSTGEIHTDWEAETRAAIEAFKRHDFVFLHQEAPDEAGHQGNPEDKIKTIEYLDSKHLKPILEYLDANHPRYRVLILPDHPTPWATKDHIPDPVPYVLYRSEDAQKSRVIRRKYTERDAQEAGVFLAHGKELMPRMMAS